MGIGLLLLVLLITSKYWYLGVTYGGVLAYFLFRSPLKVVGYDDHVQVTYVRRSRTISYREIRAAQVHGWGPYSADALVLYPSSGRTVPVNFDSPEHLAEMLNFLTIKEVGVRFDDRMARFVRQEGAQFVPKEN